MEVHHNGGWGTVCADNFDKREGLVICRMLGYDDSYVYIASITNVNIIIKVLKRSFPFFASSFTERKTVVTVLSRDKEIEISLNFT